ncbi:retrotransposon-related protein [Trifolium pratense]|uniref:Retrotransposon-related protein n=1 Tax=Trifolium pratense TaxID=57577 RepID=A0A2K3MXB4_TRIPR|nr:retrotransposon-related protein [Trifolium pratense]
MEHTKVINGFGVQEAVVVRFRISGIVSIELMSGCTEKGIDRNLMPNTAEPNIDVGVVPPRPIIWKVYSRKRETVSEYRIAVKKVELPSFDGEDPVGWIKRAETYFEVQGTTEEVKVRLAKLSMEGTTIHWFTLWKETEDELSRLKLKQALIEGYGGRQCDNPFEELKDLQQKGTGGVHCRF